MQLIDLPPVETRGQIRQAEIELARRPVTGDQQASFTLLQNAVVEVKDRHLPRLIARDALDIIDADQRQMLHPFQHFRNKPGAFIERHIAHGIAALREFGAGGMQQMAAPGTFA